MHPIDLRIDGDAIVYIAGFAADYRGGELSHSLYNAKLIIENIKTKFYPNQTTVFLTSQNSEDNFRFKLVSDYKANRKGAPKPKFYKEIRKYLIDRYSAIVCKWGEADDWLCTDTQENTVIASKDKDLLMVPATHYRIHLYETIVASDPGELLLIEKNGKKECKGHGFKWFVYQLLYGDSVDNIHKPLKNFGPVKIHKILSYRHDIYTMWKTAELFYRLVGKEDLLMINAQLLWMSRKPEQIFSVSVLEDLINAAKN